ncbi:hypothetical protein RCS94_03855 [Orbaceae bacterium ac157xtp]
MIAPSSYGALSATSANTIKGNKPELVGRTVAKKLGFEVGGTPYSEVVGNINPSTAKEFDKDLKLNEFVPKSLLLSDLTVGANYSDVDGDVAHTTAPFTLGSASRKWYESNGALISDETKNLGCSGFRLPLTLKISVPVQVHSNYGAPRDGAPDVLEQSYKITTLGFCFAKPNSLTWWDANGSANSNTGNATPSPIRGGGYNSDHFVSGKGFKASTSPKFPTTGFPGAEFTLIMTSNANDYTFSSNSSAVTVDTTGKVTLNSKPSGAVTIKAIFKNDTSQVHSYTFNPTSVWVRPTGASSQGTYAWAKTQCGSESNIPTRADLTNTPLKNLAAGGSIISNYFTRAVGGGVFGEWGYTNSSNYPGSRWYSSYHCWYWTRDPYSSEGQFNVHSSYGYVHWRYTSGSYYVACLE